MPTGTRREDVFVDLFLSTYENESWKGAEIERPEKEKDNAVEAIATRKSDGQKLAIEHTLIQPFVGDRDDFAQFWPAFEEIDEDRSLIVPERITYVYVPVGTLNKQRAKTREAIIQQTRDFLRAKAASFPEGWSDQLCPIKLIGKPALDLKLTVEVISEPGYDGAFMIRRQAGKYDLGDVVEKALKQKLPKLSSAACNRRILMLERQHMRLMPQEIIDEVERLRPGFPDLDKVDEIWLVETIAYEREGIVSFDLYDNQHKTIARIVFVKGKVFQRWDKRWAMQSGSMPS